MVRAPARFCRSTGCRTLVLDGSGYCALHKGQRHRIYDRHRKPSSQRGYDGRWRKVRRIVLERDLYSCIECGETRGVMVHHKRPIFEGGPALDPENCETLCPSCHQRKHAAMEAAR